MRFLTPLCLLLLAPLAHGEDMRHHWDFDRLTQVPEMYEADTEGMLTGLDARNSEAAFTGEGVRGIYYDGLAWQGKPTRVFAWYGAPEHKPGERLPAMVLVHGGGGTAFDEWVRVWNRRGYAALAMDTTGTRPSGKPGNRPRHEWSGPFHYGDVRDIDWPVEDQWVYHAVADVILGHSLLRSFPEVDPARVGLTGISWGGVLTSIVTGIDHRFRFGAPVYGCGFLGESVALQGRWKNMGEERAQRWLELWDPSHYVSGITVPTLWVNGTNDRHFQLSIYRRTVEAAGGPKHLCVRVRMPHSHIHGWRPEEIYVFADAVLRGGARPPCPVAQGCSAGQAWARFDAVTGAVKAELIYTREPNDWVDCTWDTAPAEWDAAKRTARAALPDGCQAWFVNLVEQNGHVWSSNCAVVGE